MATTRRCAFCNCGERSLLGQGDLTRYDPTPGFNPFRRQVTRGTRSSGFDLDDRLLDKVTRPGSSRRSRAALKPTRYMTFTVCIQQIQGACLELL